MKKFLIVLGVFLIFSCSSDSTDIISDVNTEEEIPGEENPDGENPDGENPDGENPDEGNTFSRNALLKNWVNNIINPAYTDFNSKLTALALAETDFVSTPSESSLQKLQNELFEAQKAWQHVAMFEFGRAEELNYRLFMNTYPIDELTTEDNSNEDDNTLEDNLKATRLPIASINFALRNRANEQGFPTVDYLVNGVASNQSEIVAFYSTNSNASNHKEYLTKVVDRMEDLTSQVVAYWENNSNAVIANDGSSATASFDKLANDFLNYFEQGFREAKIATPSGKRNGNIKRETVESFYSSQNSKALFTEAYTAVKNLYFGNSFNDPSINGISFDDYLNELNATAFDTTTRKDRDLTEYIESQWTIVDTEADKLDDDFIVQIDTNNTQMLTVFNEIQRTVLLFKINSFQAMNVLVDFVDSDGD